jgi:hypothetical protein
MLKYLLILGLVSACGARHGYQAIEPQKVDDPKNKKAKQKSELAKQLELREALYLSELKSVAAVLKQEHGVVIDDEQVAFPKLLEKERFEAADAALLSDLTKTLMNYEESAAKFLGVTDHAALTTETKAAVALSTRARTLIERRLTLSEADLQMDRVLEEARLSVGYAVDDVKDQTGALIGSRLSVATRRFLSDGVLAQHMMAGESSNQLRSAIDDYLNLTKESFQDVDLVQTTETKLAKIFAMRRQILIDMRDTAAIMGHLSTLNARLTELEAIGVIFSTDDNGRVSIIQTQELCDMTLVSAFAEDLKSLLRQPEAPQADAYATLKSSWIAKMNAAREMIAQ